MTSTSTREEINGEGDSHAWRPRSLLSPHSPLLCENYTLLISKASGGWGWGLLAGGVPLACRGAPCSQATAVRRNTSRVKLRPANQLLEVKGLFIPERVNPCRGVSCWPGPVTESDPGLPRLLGFYRQGLGRRPCSNPGLRAEPATPGLEGLPGLLAESAALLWPSWLSAHRRGNTANAAL